VALVDELDFLLTKQQTVLYNFFEWPTKDCGVRLCVIGVANTMDLPERLEPKVRSRLGCEKRLIFQPYGVEDITVILKDRLQSVGALDAFEPRALEMAAKKTYSYTGDCRRALQVCARAAENCESATVSMKDVTAAWNAVSNLGCLRAVKECSTLEKVVLIALCYEFRNRSSDLLNIEHLYSRLQRVVLLDSAHVTVDDETNNDNDDQDDDDESSSSSSSSSSDSDDSDGNKKKARRAEALKLAVLKNMESYSDLLHVLHGLHDANILTIEPNADEPRLPNVRFNIDDRDVGKALVDIKHALAVRLLS